MVVEEAIVTEKIVESLVTGETMVASETLVTE